MATTLDFWTKGGWGSHVQVTVADTREAQAAAQAWLERAVPPYTGGSDYNGWSLEEPGEVLTMEWSAFLFPTCHHGMAADLCADPVGDNHFGTRAQEMARGDW